MPVETKKTTIRKGIVVKKDEGKSAITEAPKKNEITASTKPDLSSLVTAKMTTKSKKEDWEKGMPDFYNYPDQLSYSKDILSWYHKQPAAIQKAYYDKYSKSDNPWINPKTLQGNPVEY